MSDDHLVRFYCATATDSDQKCSVCDEAIPNGDAFVRVGRPVSVDICIHCAAEMRALLVLGQDYEQRARGQDWVQMSLF